MPDTSLARKLTLRLGQSMLVAHAPDGYNQALSPLPEGVTLTEIGALAGLADATAGTYDNVQVFFTLRAEVEQSADAAIRALKPGGALWLCYPKLSAKATRGASDLTRDTGWDAFTAREWRPVTQVALDATWSALRFKPIADVPHTPVREV
ncbi:MAG TPA: hypothetical protein VMV29_13585 [Ktedonobacterales bacterium]|nr:hypothetical protein [Ktedonobacterales bacterium]